MSASQWAAIYQFPFAMEPHIKGNFAFACPGGRSCVRICDNWTSRPHICKRRRPAREYKRLNDAQEMTVMKARNKEPIDTSDRAWIEHEHAEMRKEHLPPPGLPPLGPTPAELTGFYGWRERDNAYWEDFRKREVSFRAPNTHEPDDFIGPPQPLDRNGQPTKYAAAVQYDPASGEWVPTSAEEEEWLRKPNPIKDPYFIDEALPGEMHTTMSRRSSPNLDGSDSELQDVHNANNSQIPGEHVRELASHRRKPLNLVPGAWKVVHLGTSSAVPTRTRNVSATAVLMQSRSQPLEEPSMFLVDAGENTDERLIQCDWCMTHGFRWIRAIFITHLHGDHIYGLPMLLADIGEYAQYRRRKALENGEDGSDLVVRIFGPYGTRGFVRSSLYWTNPVGVRFAVAELVPREEDFRDLRMSEGTEQCRFFIVEDGEVVEEDFGKGGVQEMPPPHPEEVRMENVHAGEDGLWHVWEERDGDVIIEVVAAPLRHRMPCFGYVFRERKVRSEGVNEPAARGELNGGAKRNSTGIQNGVPQSIEIDAAKAKEFGVHGTQLRVLRSGRAVTVSKTGQIVEPGDVAIEEKFERKVTILGDTCDSRAIAEAAMDSDLLVHEATFTEHLKAKAKVAMHSTARMAGRFAREVRARKLALTHFSSRYEFLQQVLGEEGDVEQSELDGVEGEGDDLASPNILVREAVWGFGEEGANVVAAFDFMEHDFLPVGWDEEGNAEAGVVEERSLEMEVKS